MNGASATTVRYRQRMTGLTWMAAGVMLGLLLVGVGVGAGGQELFGETATIDGWSGIRVIGLDDGSCPAGWTVDATFAGRMIVGTPAGGTHAATVGDALSDTELRRGGSAAGYSSPSVSGGSVSYSSPSVNYTRPTVSHGNLIVSHQHQHAYADVHVINVVAVDAFAATDIPVYTPGTTTTNRTTAGQNAQPSVTGDTVSISGGGVTLSGGGVSYSAPSISGGGYADQAPPAPYVQLPICRYDP